MNVVFSVPSEFLFKQVIRGETKLGPNLHTPSLLSFGHSLEIPVTFLLYILRVVKNNNHSLHLLPFPLPICLHTSELRPLPLKGSWLSELCLILHRFTKPVPSPARAPVSFELFLVHLKQSTWIYFKTSPRAFRLHPKPHTVVNKNIAWPLG